jgi:hypothetical protein
MTQTIPKAACGKAMIARAAGLITYKVAPFAMSDVPEREYVEVRIKLSPEQAAEIRSERTAMSCGYALPERSVFEADSGVYAQPLMHVGPVQSWTLREVRW